MTADQLADLSPGVSYARALVEGIAKRCNPNTNTAAATRAARAEANNLSRLIEWAILPLARAAKNDSERGAWSRLAEQLQRFGTGEELHADYPEATDKTALILDNMDEMARRIETALAKLKPAREQSWHALAQAPVNFAWFDRPPAVRFPKVGAR